MRKTLIKMLAACAGLLCLNSCNLDMFDNYSFTNRVIYYVDDKDNIGKEIEDYFNKVLEDRELPAIAATSHEAMTYGQEYFAETVELLDEDYLVSLLDRDVEAEKPGDGEESGEPSEDEQIKFIRISMYMTGSKTNVEIAWATYLPSSVDLGESTGTTPES